MYVSCFGNPAASITAADMKIRGIHQNKIVAEIFKVNTFDRLFICLPRMPNEAPEKLFRSNDC